MKILIIEDEQAAVRRLQKLLSEIDSQNEVIGAVSTIEAAAQWINENPAPDLILMDIHLADGSSFEIFEKAEISSPVIFATAYDEYALKAFKVNAIDYLLKPIKAVELEQAIQKVVRKTKKTDAADSLLQKLTEAGFIKKHKRVLVRMGQALKLVDLDQVSFFYSRDKISFAVMPGNKRYPLDQSLDQIEHDLDPTRFFRINRQFIINVSAIVKLTHASKSRFQVFLRPKTEYITITSFGRTDNFCKWILGDLHPANPAVHQY